MEIDMRLNVPTSNIEWVEYDEDSGSLFMQFDTGKCVRYENVPSGYAIAMVQAPSAGSFFNRHIKGIYRYVVVESPGMPAKPIDELTRLRHEYDSTRGLWCIDKDPKEVDLEWIRKNAFQLNPTP